MALVCSISVVEMALRVLGSALRRGDKGRCSGRRPAESCEYIDTVWTTRNLVQKKWSVSLSRPLCSFIRVLASKESFLSTSVDDPNCRTRVSTAVPILLGSEKDRQRR